MIRLESSGSYEEVRQNILRISWDENEMSKNPLTLIMDTNKFNGTNYNEWLRNLRIVVDFENQGYVLDKPLLTALLEGSSPEERLTFDKWLKDNCKVRSIILGSMTNEIQKQYDRLDDVPSIILDMKEVYAVPDRHIRYTATKAFFGTKMVKGSSVQSHGVKMFFLVEKLENLKAGLDNDTYIDATTYKFVPTILVGEASTSKAKGKRVGRWKRKKGKGKAVAVTASAGGAPTAPIEKGKGKVGGS
ncbi:UNVERIFIED_CONTAM: hypothetical protein Sradi_3599800 [Sesamum radiatum]|uniref:Retrotransposon Copia-like N-terminal domain-containing protein n=1 Tax=Sesamum radiatum TaxID=300843 RepID=A0AAW2QI25_SESRA